MNRNNKICDPGAGRRNALIDLKNTPLKNKKNEPSINQTVYEKFRKFAVQQYFKSIQNVFKNAIGKHNPVEYKPEFGFSEQWEIIRKQKGMESKKDNKLYLLYASLQVILIMVCLWSLSMSLVFEWSYRGWIYIIIIIITLEQCWMMFWHKRMFLTTNQILKKTAKEALTLCVSLIEIIAEKVLPLQLSIIFAFIVASHLYVKASKRYDDVKIFHISSIYRNHINLFDLFFMLISITHAFALALYAVALLNVENWMVKISIQHEDWVTKYIYALYFSCTTLLTVGYGDLSPTNVPQVIMILITEIIGIATFAYTVNQIGAALSSMQEKKQKMQKDLNNVENMGDTYQLDSGVLCRMRTELKNSQQILDNMCVEDENQLLNKFSDDLREEINFQSSIKVMKRSVFMITNWTGLMQGKIAKKLVKHIYNAEEPLIQTPGREKLFVIDQGRIEIITDAFEGEKSSFKRVLKTLSASKDSQVLVSNVFGYSNVMSDRTIRLRAVCKESCICYTLLKKDFIQCLTECDLDLQRYHEIKLKIDLAKMAEEIEAPRVSNIREHYNPSIHYLLQKNEREVVQNKRRKKKRKTGRRRSNIEFFNAATLERLDSNNRKTKTMKRVLNGCQSLLQINQEKEDENQNNQELNSLNFFQSAKEYERFFKNKNHQAIISRLNTRNLFFKRSVRDQRRNVHYQK